VNREDVPANKVLLVNGRNGIPIRVSAPPIILIPLIIFILIIGKRLKGVRMIWFAAKGNHELGRMVGLVARITAVVHTSCTRDIGIVVLWSRFQSSRKVTNPSGRHKFRAGVPLDLIFKFVEGDSVDRIVACKGRVQLVLDHPLHGVFEVFF